MPLRVRAGQKRRRSCTKWLETKRKTAATNALKPLTPSLVSDKVPELSGTFKKPKVGDTGTEQPAQNTGKTLTTDGGDAESGAPRGKSAIVDRDLVRLIAAWSHLPAAVRRGIVAMIVATKQDEL